MSRRRLTPNQQAYQKELRRLKQGIYRAKKRGYQFSEDVLPETPKRISKKRLREIQEYKTSDIYKKARKVDTETGEILKGTQARKIERREAGKKAWRTRQKRQQIADNKVKTYDTQPQQSQTPKFPNFDKIVISNFRGSIRAFENGDAYEILDQWIKNLIATRGEHDVASMLQNGAENGLIIQFNIVYKRAEAISYMSAMLDYLPDLGENEKQMFFEALEIYEDWETPF